MIPLQSAIQPIVMVHGGAGDISESGHAGKFHGTKMAVQLGYAALMETGSVLDAVETAIRSMEVDETFNCGYGSVLTRNYTIEMDASIMNGRDLRAGCVSGVRDILNPISLARRVMEHTPHTFIGGHEATRDLAQEAGFKILNPGDLVTPRAKAALDNYLANQVKDKDGVGTVGAVAIDEFGNMAAATSTGGLTGKWAGRVGDTPVIGSGTIADNRYGCMSATGDGDHVLRVNLGRDILNRIRYLNADVHTATRDALQELLTMTGHIAGVIVIDKNGEIALDWNTEKMSFAYRKGDQLCYGITKEHRDNPLCEQVAANE